MIVLGVFRMSQDFFILGLEIEATALFMCAVALSIAFWREITLKRLHATIEDVLNVPGRGLILFDKNKKFMKANEEAQSFVSKIISYSRGSAQAGLTLEDLLNYTFDHAVEADESLKLAISKFPKQRTGESFREIIKCDEHNLCLIDASKSARGRYVINLYDLTVATREEDKALRLADYNHELASAIEAATNCIVIAKRSGDNYKIIFANKAFYALIDIAESEVVNKDAKQVFFSFINDDVSREMLLETLHQREDGFVELKSDSPSGPRWYSMKHTPINIENSRKDAFIAVFTDVTDLKIKESEFSRTQKMEALGQLAAGVAHDFNNILSVVGGFARIACKKADDKTICEYMDKIQNATDRGAKLTSQLLTFSRHKVKDEVVINLSQVIEEQEVLLQPLLPASVEVSLHIHDHLLKVEASSDHIMQMVMNFVLNAKEAMPEGGALNIDLRALKQEEITEAIKAKCGQGRVCCLSIADTGKGIAPDVIGKIFDPFFTTKDKGEVKGTGLGLFMIYGLIQQMSGHIDVESELGVGTTFRMYFPITEKTLSKTITGNLDDLDAISFEGYTALIAEDEPDLLALVTSMFEDLGMTVLAAKNGNEALLKQDEYEGKIDLLLTDLIMPELGGFYLATLFKAERPDTPIIFMSGYPEDSQELQNGLPEDYVFIAKPIKYDQLIRIIYQILSHPEGGQKAVDALLASEDGQAARWQSDGRAASVIEENAGERVKEEAALKRIASSK